MLYSYVCIALSRCYHHRFTNQAFPNSGDILIPAHAVNKCKSDILKSPQCPNRTKAPTGTDLASLLPQQITCRISFQVSRILFYLTSRSFRSKISCEFGGIPAVPLLPYPSDAGTVMRRSPPADIPATPMSQPLITSPAPSLKLNGVPFLFAEWFVSRDTIETI